MKAPAADGALRECDPIVRPVCSPRTPRLGPLALLAASEADAAALQARLLLPQQRRLYMSTLYHDGPDSREPALIGPLMGAPYAAMLLEILYAWGARQFFFLGWCGSIDQRVRTGDIVLPRGAWIDEGTSPHYQRSSAHPVQPDAALGACLQSALQQRQACFHQELIWTTDGVFRETPAKVAAFQQRGAVAVEMELSALLSVAEFHGVPLAALLVVSDELFTLRWQPGFKDERFLKARRLAGDVLMDVLKNKCHDGNRH